VFMTDTRSLAAQLQRFRNSAFKIGVGGLVLSGIGFLLDPNQAFVSYLYAFLFWSSASLGSMGLLLLYHVVGGYWGLAIRRPLEAAVGNVSMVALAFVPLVFGIKTLYLWARLEVVALDPLLQHKAIYLNENSWVIRSIFYLAVWMVTARSLIILSRREDEDPGGPSEFRLQQLAPVGLILYVLTVTFASMDWGMSLEPHWISTIYGLVFIMGQAIIGLALSVLTLATFRESREIREVLVPAHFHDIGTLTFAFVMLWAYMALSQFLIIWSANIPEEVHWFQHRLHGGWEYLGLFVIAFQFIFPFFALLSRTVKRNPEVLAKVAIALLAVRVVDMYWTIVPSLYPHSIHFHLLDICALAGLGGVWVSRYLDNLASSELFPDHIASQLEGAKHG